MEVPPVTIEIRDHGNRIVFCIRSWRELTINERGYLTNLENFWVWDRERSTATINGKLYEAVNITLAPSWECPD